MPRVRQWVRRRHLDVELPAQRLHPLRRLGHEPFERLHVRIGMATGLVVVSDVTGRVVEKSSIIGSTPNLASRLQGLAGRDGP